MLEKMIGYYNIKQNKDIFLFDIPDLAILVGDMNKLEILSKDNLQFVEELSHSYGLLFYGLNVSNEQCCILEFKKYDKIAKTKIWSLAKMYYDLQIDYSSYISLKEILSI